MPSAAPEATPLWDFAELVAAAGGIAEGQPSGMIKGFSLDSRTIAPDEVFVALKDQRDGHDFVGTAFARGAAAALVALDYARKDGDGALIRVADTLEGLRAIAKAARARLSKDARVIAVTGSAGKTGTTAMLRACLATQGATHAPEKSFNNHWGVPLTLARMPASTRFAVIEIGMNHENEIRPLVRLARPHIAIVTNVLPVHVGNFSDGETGVANAKAEIFEDLEPGGTAIVLRDSPHYERLCAKAEGIGAKVRTFGGHQDADARLENRNGVNGEVLQPVQEVDFTIRRAANERGPVGTFSLGMAGDHLATNALAVVLALDSLGVRTREVLRPLGEMTAPHGRGGRMLLDNGRILLIDESYNANPASMAAALGNLGGVPRDRHVRRIAVMGDMLELGPAAAEYHVGLKDATASIALSGPSDQAFLCGPNMKHLFDALPESRRGAWRPTSAELLPHVVAVLQPGDAIMVKGSLGSRMAPIVDAIKKRFAGSPA